MVLNPIYKWAGGKRREIDNFSLYYPLFVKGIGYTYVEPFLGGGAVYWSIDAGSYIINDIDYDLINFLKVLRDKYEDIKSICNIYSNKINDITIKERLGEISIEDGKKYRGEIYYEWRNKDRGDGLKDLSDIDRAFRFLLVNQLSFNGMRRFNSRGEFNIPYGNYKTFNPVIRDGHIDKLKKTDIYCGSYKDIMINNDNYNTFIYIDPPYTREFKEYTYDNKFGLDEQLELYDIFSRMDKSSVMIIINKDDFTLDLYKDYIRGEYSLKYSTNIKNRYNNMVEHLIITNY